MRNTQSPLLGEAQETNPAAPQGVTPGETHLLRPLASTVYALGLLAFIGAWVYIGNMQTGRCGAMYAPHHFKFCLPTFAFEWLLFG